MQPFKRGDVVSVTGTVKFDQAADQATIYLDIDGASAVVTVERAQLVRPFFKPGEKAFLPPAQFDETGEWEPVDVLAAHEQFVWIKQADGDTNVVLAVELKREKRRTDMNKPFYKKLEIRLSDESQTYICESRVDERQIRSGDETGIVCHMVDASKADLLVAYLNTQAGIAAP